MHDKLDRKPLWIFTAAAGLLLLAVFLAGSHILKANIAYFLRMNAMVRLQEWAHHISQEREDVITDLLQGRNAKAALRHLSREAEHYDIISFSIAGHGTGRKWSVRVPRSSASIGLSTDISTESPYAGLLGLPDIFGGEERLGGKPLAVSIANSRGKTIAQLEARLDQYHLEAQLKDTAGRILLVSLLGFTLLIGVGWLVWRQMARDAEHKLTIVSGHDRLTGLPNRAKFSADTDALLARAEADGRMAAFFHITIDNFNRISSIHGFEAAEELLQILAIRLLRHAREDALLGHIGSDSFMLVKIVDSAEEAREAGHHIMRTMRRPAAAEPSGMHHTASVGAAVFPADGEDRRQLERRATLACWAAAKEGGDTLLFYGQELHERHEQHQRLEERLREAVEREDFEIHFQPLVHLKGNRLHGFEALLRLTDAKGDFISPECFIPLAEKLQLMDKLGAFVLRESCRIAAAWPEGLNVAVNVSPCQFKSGHLPQQIRAALAESGLDARRLEIEVTESFLVEDSPSLRRQLDELHEMGVHIVLDDFGTGFSSFNYLWRFRFDKVKIDRSFISAMHSSQQARSILRTMLVMFRALGVKVTAEGIEEASQAAFLRKLRCDYGQGYYFARPMPAGELAHFILHEWRERMGLSPHAKRKSA